MTLQKAADIRQLSDEELEQEIISAKKLLFELRFKKATRQLDKEVHQFKHTRRRLAQMMTVRHERQLSETGQPAGADG